MVDHRADEDGNFRIFVGAEDEPRFAWTRFRDAMTVRLRGLFTPRAGRDDVPDEPYAADIPDTETVPDDPYDTVEGPSRQVSTNTRIAIGITLVWILAFGAYGLGYFLRLEEASVARPLPTVDLLFFGFAVGGPIAMIWVVVLMLNRSERLTEAIALQSETALALATTIANLNDTVDALSAGTTVRLDDACYRMERSAADGMARLGGVLDEVGQKVDRTILDSVIVLDKSIRERLQQVEATLAEERSAFADRLDSDAQQMTRKIEQSATDTKERLAAAIDAVVSDQETRLEETNRRAHEVLDRLATTVAETISARAQAMDEDMRRHQGLLDQAADRTRRTIEEDLIQPITAVRDTLQEAKTSIAANPPASAAELAKLLNEAASQHARPELEALSSSVERIAALEQQARSLLAQIDRTQRMTPAILDDEVAASDSAIDALPDHPAEAAPDELPFGALPRLAARGRLDWTVAIEVLDAAKPRPANRAAMASIAADPDIAALMRASAEIEAELADDGLYLEDVRPEHAPASLWARFARGGRGEAVMPIAGVEDDISLAIVRGRLRRAPGFRAAALRFSHCYIAVLQRAVGEIGTDQRLIEMAETRIGRAFVLLAGPLGLLDEPTCRFDA